MNATNGITVTKVSPIYETEPVGYVEQPQFLNLCLEIQNFINCTSIIAKYVWKQNNNYIGLEKSIGDLEH
ncbi:7, 8-dihydro-6-hydroxymethylpterin-pyrophosphokinase [Staphylococcus gallinarum]|uniref:2-amino-4-hydroxy-6-hydroxymethyldihydropteridine diphosphokinase n=1 Tax=Staphylococcus gallinarum TaxID=1293 RepID=A0A380FDE8_STAGA|nr:7, 8-dihydro-6-hydroxymethylpterin-pyrophosphokinase [Staphylococcus gallinarum]